MPLIQQRPGGCGDAGGVQTRQLQDVRVGRDFHDELVAKAESEQTSRPELSEDLGDGLSRSLAYGYITRQGDVLFVEKPALDKPSLDGFEAEATSTETTAATAQAPSRSWMAG